jgi:hypothetical protein
VLNMIEECLRISECTEAGIDDTFAMAGRRYFAILEEKPVFSIGKFYGVCTSVCKAKSYSARKARRVLCGY